MRRQSECGPKHLARKAGFSLLEMVAALGIMTGVAISFAGTMQAVQRLERHLDVQSQAILVLNNVLTRLEACKAWTRGDLERIGTEELAASHLGQYPDVRMVVAGEPDRPMASIVDGPERVVVKVEFAK